MQDPTAEDDLPLDSFFPNVRYGPIEFIDYLLPDDDPNFKKMQVEPEEYTLKRYSHNRKKVFFWTNLTLLFSTIATVFVGMAGLMVGAELTSPLGQWMAGVAGSAEAAAGIAASILPWLGVGAVLSGGLAFLSGYYSFRTDIKNDVDVETLHAKLTGRYVASHLYEMLTAKEAGTKILDAQAVEPLEFGEKLTPYDVRTPPAATEKTLPATEKPQSVVQHANEIGKLVEEAQLYRHHMH